MNAVVLALALAVPPVAHPMGNFSVNQYHEIVLRPDRVEVLVVVDSAELPTLAAKRSVDTDGDGVVSDVERRAHAERTCADAAAGLTVRAGAQTAQWTVPASDFGYTTGAGGLDVSRLECSITAPLNLGQPTEVTVGNSYLSDQVGWREMTATVQGLRLLESPLPATSVTDRLRSYQDDVLSSVLDVRAAVLRVEPGEGIPSAAATRPSSVDPLTRLVAAADRRLQSLVGGELTLPVALLAVLLALLLGAAHAALPGHGKTVMAAYLAGTRGRVRDAVAVGGAVTASHTLAVLVIGGLLAAGTAVIGGSLMRALSLASAAIVICVGIAMLAGAVRAQRYGHHHGHDHHHGHSHDHQHGHDHDQGHGSKVHTGRWNLAGIGLAGGLVPSPSALVVLLAAVGLGQAAFGVALVVVYGLGMAATLTAAGLLLVAAQRRLRTLRWPDRLRRMAGRGTAAVPTVTAAMIVVVGCGLALRAAGGAV